MIQNQIFPNTIKGSHCIWRNRNLKIIVPEFIIRELARCVVNTKEKTLWPTKQKAMGPIS